VGPVGSGQLAKLANQMMVASTIAAVAEALLFAERGGADPAQVREALLGGFADSTVLRQHGLRMVQQQFKPGGTAKYQAKDTSTALSLAKTLGLELPVLRVVDWLQSVELRQRVHAGLNKGEIRDRDFEQQRWRASGLTLVTAAIVRWNTVYLTRAVAAPRSHGQAVDDTLLPHLSPLGWKHINLTGDYVWRGGVPGKGRLRPLRPVGWP
jgi:hypothetical protein